LSSTKLAGLEPLRFHGRSLEVIEMEEDFLDAGG
jgi:hypothetical protein